MKLQLILFIFLMSLSGNAQTFEFASFVDDLWNGIVTGASDAPLMLKGVDLTPNQKVVNSKTKKKLDNRTNKSIEDIHQKLTLKEDTVSVKQSATTKFNNTQTSLGSTSFKNILKNFSFKSNLEYTSNLVDAQSLDKNEGLSIQAALIYKLNEDFKLQATFSGDKELSNGREEFSNDTKLSLLNKSHKLIGKLTYAPSISLVIPTGKASQEMNRLNTVLEINTSFAYKINDFLSFSYNPRLNKYFHEYQTNRNGTTLPAYAVEHFLFSSYSFTEKFSFNPGILYSNTWNYNKRRIADTYVTVIDVSYSIDKKMSISAGVRTFGSVIDNEEGKDEKVVFWSDNSIGYLGLSKTF